MAKYDEICPRGSVHTDRTADIDIYLRKHPGLLNLRSSTVLADDAIIADIGIEDTKGTLCKYATAYVDTHRRNVDLAGTPDAEKK